MLVIDRNRRSDWLYFFIVLVRIVFCMSLLVLRSLEKKFAHKTYVQPRSRKIRSKIGMGIPKSQSKMYPVAPDCLIRFIKRISVSFLNVIGLNVRVCTNGPVIAKIDGRGDG
jgi:hypothetical protein